MKKIVLFDTAQGSLNLGDDIIKECLEQEMEFVFNNECIARYSTHTPISRFYQTFRKNIIYKTCNSADYKFLCGTNLFKSSLIRISPDWNINFTSCEYYRGSIAIGCGMDMNAKHSDPYTRWIYKQILSKDYIHSVRDERTKRYFESLGVKAINTGCPTLWGLTPKKCASIPRNKSKYVVFTLTDYKRDEAKDKKMISVLRECYDKLYFWVQGFHDYDYLSSIADMNDIRVIPHSINAYREVLLLDDIDYVGTRLHAGIYAMRHGVRSLIISVDNRADDMKETYNIPTLSRYKIEDKLKDIITANFETKIIIPTDRIEQWKGQFK